MNNTFVTKHYGINFTGPKDAESPILTLSADTVSNYKFNQYDAWRKLNTDYNQIHSRTHSSGWTISGKVTPGFYIFVGDFEAIHPQLGRVWGSFTKQVNASSEEAYRHFYEYHTPIPWDENEV